MDITCQQCGTEYEFDESRVGPSGVTVKCTACESVFEVFPPARSAPSRGPSTSIGAGPQGKEWLVRHANGRMVAFRELTTLQKWIIEGRIGRDDEISKTAETWKRLGNINELEPFFAIYEKAQNYDQLMTSADIPAAIEDLRHSQIIKAVHPSQIDSRATHPLSEDLLAPPIRVDAAGAPALGSELPHPEPAGPILSPPAAAGPTSGAAAPLPGPISGAAAPLPGPISGTAVSLSGAVLSGTSGSLSGAAALAGSPAEALRPMSGIQLPEGAAHAPMTRPASPAPRASEGDSHRFEDMGLASTSAAPAAFPAGALEFPGAQPPDPGWSSPPAPANAGGGSGWIWKLVMMLVLGIGLVVGAVVASAGLQTELSALDAALSRQLPTPTQPAADSLPDPAEAAQEAERLWARGQPADLARALTLMELAQGQRLNDDALSADHAVVLAAVATTQRGGTRERSLETTRSLLLSPQRGQPKALKTRRAEAMYHFASKDLASLRAHLKDVGEAGAGDPLLTWLSAEAALGEVGLQAKPKVLKKAAERLRAALKLNPSLNVARMRLAQVLAAQGKNGAAADALKPLLAEAPDVPGAHALAARLGLSKPASQPVPKPAKAPAAGSKPAPASPRAKAPAPATKPASGSPVASKTPPPPVRAPSPTPAPDYRSLMTKAKRTLGRGRARTALKLYQEASRLKRTPEVLIGMGWCYLELDRLRTARAHFDRALETRPDAAEAHYGIGLAYEDLGHRKSAKAAYERYLQLSPDGADAAVVRQRLKQLGEVEVSDPL